jgi:hypothetical protein
MPLHLPVLGRQAQHPFGYRNVFGKVAALQARSIL